jgi:hypothetical protein
MAADAIPWIATGTLLVLAFLAYRSLVLGQETRRSPNENA